jgi:dTDP-L-rhamnose 4-epimerase
VSERILVTGGAGFIGSHLVDELVARGDDVIVLDCLSPQVHRSGEVPDYLNRGAEFFLGDVRDRRLLTWLVNQCDVIYHQAAVVGVGQSMYEIERYCDVNVQGTATLLDVLANEDHQVRRVIVASSMSIYGEGAYRCPEHGPIDPGLRTPAELQARRWQPRCARCGGELVAVATPESSPTRAPNVYALSKKMQEELTLNVCAAYGISAVALRYFNVYGPRQSLSNPYTGVAAIFMSRLKNGNPPLIFEDGQQSRDFISVHDIVSANLAALDAQLEGCHAFNVGTGRPTTVLDVAGTLADILGVQVRPVLAGEYRQGDVRACFGDTAKAEKTLGFKAQVSLEDGLKELCEWSAHRTAVDRVERATEELVAHGLIV